MVSALLPCSALLCSALLCSSPQVSLACSLEGPGAQRDWYQAVPRGDTQVAFFACCKESLSLQKSLKKPTFAKAKLIKLVTTTQTTNEGLIPQVALAVRRKRAAMESIRAARQEALELLGQDLEGAALRVAKGVRGLAPQEESAKLLVLRAGLEFRAGNAQQAREDAELALRMDALQAAWDRQQAHYWRCKACVALGDLTAARESFEQAREAGKASASSAGWLQRETQLNELAPKVAAAATEGSSKSAAAPAPAPTRAPAPAPAPAPAATPAQSNIRYDWYQSATHVIITVMAKKVKEEDITVSMQPKAVSIGIREPAFTLQVDLFDRIVPDASSVNVMQSKVELKLAKVAAGSQWPTLSSLTDAQALPQPTTNPVVSVVTGTGAALPTPYAGNKKWDEIEKALASEAEEEYTGDAALNKLFRDIYSKADEDTRRAMIKSYQTSAGTCLSTNWEEVSKKDYTKDIKPPKGMEFKKYGTDEVIARGDP